MSNPIVMIPAKLKIAGVTFDVELSCPTLDQVVKADPQTEETINVGAINFFSRNEEGQLIQVHLVTDGVTEESTVIIGKESGEIAIKQ